MYWFLPLAIMTSFFYLGSEMTKRIIFTLLATLTFNIGFAQMKNDIAALLAAACKVKNSKDITAGKGAKILIAEGSSVLPALSLFFSDTTLTEVNSGCQGRILNKGEIAMIIADRIEMMPYSTLTGIQNCLMEFCEGNPNLIEYYFNFIKRDGVEKFQKRYVDWLNSDDRKKWLSHISHRKSKKRA